MRQQSSILFLQWMRIPPQMMKFFCLQWSSTFRKFLLLYGWSMPFFFPLFSSFLVLVLCLWNILQRPWHICRLLNSLSAFKGMCYFRLLCMLKVPIKVNFFQWCILRIAFLLSLDLTQVITIYFDSGTKYCSDCNTGKDII